VLCKKRQEVWKLKKRIWLRDLRRKPNSLLYEHKQLEHFKQIKGKEEDKSIKDVRLFNEKKKKLKGKKINGSKAEICVNNVSISVLIPNNFLSRYCFDDNSYFNFCKWQEYVGGKLLGGIILFVYRNQKIGHLQMKYLFFLKIS
jgi:hypothetical protein